MYAAFIVTYQCLAYNNQFVCYLFSVRDQQIPKT